MQFPSSYDIGLLKGGVIYLFEITTVISVCRPAEHLFGPRLTPGINLKIYKKLLMQIMT